MLKHKENPFSFLEGFCRGKHKENLFSFVEGLFSAGVSILWHNRGVGVICNNINRLFEVGWEGGGGA